MTISNQSVPLATKRVSLPIRFFLGLCVGGILGACVLTASIEFSVLFINRYHEQQSIKHGLARHPNAAKITELRNSGLRRRYKKIRAPMFLFGMAASLLAVFAYGGKLRTTLAAIPLLVLFVWWILAATHYYKTQVRTEVDRDIDIMRRY